MSGDDDLIIVGGGIGGLAAALDLGRRGHRVRVLEQARAFTEVGAGLQLGPNATRLLDGWGLFDDVDRVAVRPRRAVLMDAFDGREVTALDLGEAFVERYGHPYVVVHRVDLLERLIEACRATGRVRLATSTCVTAIEERDDEVIARCDDGTSHAAAGVVGADGLWSRTRRLFSDDEPVCTGFVAYRGTLSLSDTDPRVRADDVVMWIGPGTHVVQYPVRAGKVFNQVAVFESPSHAAGAEDWGTPEELDAHFADAAPAVRQAVRELDRDRRYPMYHRRPLDRWNTARLTLLGDAAHPMLPVLAQGACQALEDAGCLGRMIDEHDDVPDAFAAYARLRRPRTARVQRSAEIFADVWHADGIAVALRNRLFAMRADDDYEEVDWLYLPGAAEKAETRDVAWTA